MTTRNPIALTGSDAKTLVLFHDLLKSGGCDVWYVWDTTLDPVPSTLVPSHQIITFKACMYAAECRILSTYRILDRTNSNYVWIIDTDELLAKDMPALQDADQTEDVLLGEGHCRFSRRALECIARDFGCGVDYSSLNVGILEKNPPQ